MYEGIIEILLTLAVTAAFVIGVVYNDPTVKMLSLGALLAAWKGIPLFNKNGGKSNEKTDSVPLT